MDANKLSGIWMPTLVVMLTGTYAYWAAQRELVSSRPSVPGQYDVPDPLPTPGTRTVHSRMWEDPLSNAYEHWKKLHASEGAKVLRTISDGTARQAIAEDEPATEDPPANASPADEALVDETLVDDNRHAELLVQMQGYFRDLVDRSPKTVCLPVFLPGGPYAEAKEKRMRIRYAVVTALAESGYALKDNESMDYAVVRTWVRIMRGWQEREIVIPTKLYRNSNNVFEKNNTQVLVFWLNESELGLRPLLATHRILNTAFAQVQQHDHLQVAIIGPSSSGVLGNMIDENRSPPHSAPEWKLASLIPNRPIRGFAPLAVPHGAAGDAFKSVPIFSPRATIDDAEMNDQSHFRLHRVIGGDSQLASALRTELEARGVLPGKVVLITEHDTSYGREIQQTFEDAFASQGGKLAGESTLSTFKILKGIDGILPGDPKDSTKSSRAQGASTANEEIVERQPEGRSQYDYLTRLPQRIRAAFPDSPAAIGVVGSDVYDKLLVLRALKPQFPDCVFFTTDLDAIYTHADERQHTRNLIVASHFGLQLADQLQTETSPFRDSYQTATFLATRLAIHAHTQEQPVENPEAAHDETGADQPSRPRATHPAAAKDPDPVAVAWAQLAGQRATRLQGGEASAFPPLLHVVGRTRLHQLADLHPQTAGVTSQAADVHLKPTPGIRGWHAAFIAVVTLAAISGLFLLLVRDRFRVSLLLNRGWDGSGDAWITHAEAWSRRLRVGFLALLSIGLVLIVALVAHTSLSRDDAALLDGYTTWTRNLMYTVTGMTAVICIAFLLDRFVVTLHQARYERGGKICELAWETFQTTHVTTAVLTAIALIHVGVLFVCGCAAWPTLFSFLLVVTAFASAAWWDHQSRKKSGSVMPHDQLRENPVLSASPLRAMAWVGGFTLAITAIAAVLPETSAASWHPASTSRQWLTRAGDGLTKGYAFGMVGLLLGGLLSGYVWCLEFSRYARQQVSAAFPHAQAGRLQLESEYDRLWLIGKLTSVIGSIMPAVLGLLLLLAIAYHPLISPTPMPMGLLVVISLALMVFFAPNFIARWHFHRERDEILGDLDDRILRSQTALAERRAMAVDLGDQGAMAQGRSSHGDDDGSLLPVTSSASEFGAHQRSRAEHAPSRDALQHSAAAVLAPDLVRSDRQQWRQARKRIADLAEGVFRPWAQSPLGWILGGGASLALIDLWVRWWTYGL